MGMKENFWQRLIGGCWVFICFRASRGIFCLWVSTLCRAEWNQGDIEESRVWLFSDRFDDNQDLGSEGRPAGCWETPCPRNFKFAHLELFHVLNLISLERKREKFLRLSFHCFSRDSLNLRGLFPQWISLLGDREMKEIRGERDRETCWGSHSTLIIGLFFKLFVWGAPFHWEWRQQLLALAHRPCSALIRQGVPRADPGAIGLCSPVPFSGVE